MGGVGVKGAMLRKCHQYRTLPLIVIFSQRKGRAMLNCLHYGDNLDVLRNHIADESVDLVYLDPPFNSNRNYNVLFKEKSGQDSPSQLRAFTDTWSWDQSSRDAFNELVHGRAPDKVKEVVGALRQVIGGNDMMAYLIMMTQRLVELHRVLKPTGSLYLHCDPTASHYLKIVLDAVFGKERFRNEIVWKRTGAHSSSKKFGPVHDVLLYYSKSDRFTWNAPRAAYDQAYLAKYYRQDDGDGRKYFPDNLFAAGPRNGSSGMPWHGIDPTPRGMHWKFTIEHLEELDREGRIYWPPKGGMPRYKRYQEDLKGLAVGDVWSDIDPINSQGRERLGYATQKPLALLERIIQASSNPGDVVLDPFCGCGTAVAAAQKLGRQWVGIDITHLAISLMKNRLVDMFGSALKFAVRGTPEDVGSALMLAQADRYEFQYWANSLVDAQPLEADRKRGADGGIDGVIRFVDDEKERLKRVLVQVKSGQVHRNTMGELRGTIERENAEMGMLLTLQPATRPMRTEAIESGTYYSPGWNREFPRMQIWTIEELLAGAKPNVPPMRATFERAQRHRQMDLHRQSDIFGQEGS